MSFLLLLTAVPIVPEPVSTPSVNSCTYVVLSYNNLIVNGHFLITLALPCLSNNLAITFLHGIRGVLFLDKT